MPHGLPKFATSTSRGRIYVLSFEGAQVTYLLCASAASVKRENSARIVFTMKWEYTCKACRQSLETLDVIIVGHKLGTQLSELDWQPK